MSVDNLTMTIHVRDGGDEKTIITSCKISACIRYVLDD